MAEYGRPGNPWWYSRNPRRTLLIGLAVLLLCGLLLAEKGFSLVPSLLALAGLSQLAVGVRSIRLDVARELPTSR